MTNRITKHLVNALTLFGLWLVGLSIALADDCFLVEGASVSVVATVKPCGADTSVNLPDAKSRLRAEPLSAAPPNGAPTNGVLLNEAKEFRFQPKAQGDAAPQQDKWSVMPGKSNIRAAEQRPGVVELHLPAAPPATVQGSN